MIYKLLAYSQSGAALRTVPHWRASCKFVNLVKHFLGVTMNETTSQRQIIGLHIKVH